MGPQRPLTQPSCPQTLAAVVAALPRSSPAELTISALSLALLVPVKELNVRFRDRLPTPIPGEVVMVRSASLAQTQPVLQALAAAAPCWNAEPWAAGRAARLRAFPGLLPETHARPGRSRSLCPPTSRRVRSSPLRMPCSWLQRPLAVASTPTLYLDCGRFPCLGLSRGHQGQNNYPRSLQPPSLLSSASPLDSHGLYRDLLFPLPPAPLSMTLPPQGGAPSLWWSASWTPCAF